MTAKTAHGVSQPLPVHDDHAPLPKDAPEDLAFKIVDEYRDCEGRKLNLIFHNVPESQAEEPASRAADDIKSVLEITKEMGADHMEVINTLTNVIV